MSDPFLGEIRMLAGYFAPRGWAFCDGQLLSISQNDALFSLLGTAYGGDGRTTFGLPDMRGRVPVHQGQGPGLSRYQMGTKSGQEEVTITVSQLPLHSHEFRTSSALASTQETYSSVLAKGVGLNMFKNEPATEAMAPNMMSASGDTGPHFNMMPTLCVNFILALLGDYPSRP